MDIVYIPLSRYTISVKEGDCINIEITPPNKARDFLKRLHSKSEDLIFSIIQALPEKMIPGVAMAWLEQYTDKRISELKQQTIKQTWRKMNLETALNEINTRQQDKEKAPSED